MKTNLTYDQIPIMPIVIADVVANQPYDGGDISVRNRSQDHVDKIEALRLVMTYEQRKEFGQLVDKICRAAFEKEYDWFMKIVRAKGNRGRDQMYIWVKHWLSSYLNDPGHLRRMASQYSEGK